MWIEKLVGSLESVKRADVINVAMRAARQTPMYDPVSHLVYVTHGDDVQNTVVNGKILMRGRRLLTLDRDVVIADANRLAGRGRDAFSPRWSFRLDISAFTFASDLCSE